MCTGYIKGNRKKLKYSGGAKGILRNQGSLLKLSGNVECA
jgi:hypothetical protein